MKEERQDCYKELLGTPYLIKQGKSNQIHQLIRKVTTYKTVQFNYST